MIYFAFLLTGLLIGLLIKDLQFKKAVVDLDNDAYITFRQTKYFLSLLKPLSPEEFIQKMKPQSTGVGIVEGRMFLVQQSNGRLTTISDIPLKEMLGEFYNSLRIFPFLPSEREIDKLLSLISRFVV